MPPMAFSLARTLPLVCLTMSLGACAVTSADGRRIGVGSDAFADYVERVFRRQNEVATELSFALDDPETSDERFSLLAGADLELQAACRELNELARRTRDGDPARGFGAMRRARQAPDCERATDAAAALL